MRIVFLILVPLIVLAIALTGTHILVERLFILIILVLFLCYLFARLGIWQLKGYLKDPVQHSPAGQPLPVEAVVENRSPLPKIFLKLKVKISRSKPDENILINIPGNRTYSWSNHVSYERRGRYTVGPLIAESGDPFGLFQLRRTLDKGKDILIYPETAELPFFQAEAGPLQNKLRTNDTTGVISGIRDYGSGDSLSLVHWRSSAHMNKLMVKEFEVERTEKIWVILDLNREFLYGTGIETTEEYSISIAASLVKKYADSGRLVGFIAQNQNYHLFPARVGYLNMWRIMDALAVMKADGQAALPRILNRASEHFNGSAVALIVTPSLQDKVVEAIVNIRKKGTRGVLIWVDAGSFGAELSSARALARLQAFNIPVYVIKKGDNLTETLNSRRFNLTAKSGSEETNFVR